MEIDRDRSYATFKNPLKERIVRDHNGLTPTDLKNRKDKIQINHAALHIVARDFHFIAHRKRLENNEDEGAHEITQHTPHRYEADRDQAKHRSQHRYKRIQLEAPTAQNEDSRHNEKRIAEEHSNRSKRQPWQMRPLRKLQKPAVESKKKRGSNPNDYGGFDQLANKIGIK